ncbi:dienelactone hydrolase family protein [Jatrophihabitans fulvus]
MADEVLGRVDGGSQRLRGYLAEPEGTGPFPGVVVLHEALGLDDITRRHTDRLAAAGYLAFAVDLFSDGGARRCLLSTFRALLAQRGRPYADIEAARQHVAGDARCSGKVGVIGFCMGGGFALVTAARGFDAASANYGTVPRHADEVLRGACPVVASYGRRDVTLRGSAATLERTLERLGVEHDVKEYPGAGHSFLNDRGFGPSVTQPLQRIAGLGPHPASADDAWSRIEAFFERHLH